MFRHRPVFPIRVMAWSAEYAAFRYFRRIGADIKKKDRIILFHVTPGRFRSMDFDRNWEVLKRRGYDIQESLFINL